MNDCSEGRTKAAAKGTFNKRLGNLLQDGTSQPFRSRDELGAVADDVAGVIRHLGYEKAGMLGYSLGGGTALRVAIQHPDVVDRLIIVSAP